MKDDSVIFIGLDTSKLKIAVAIADGRRNGEVRYFGDISSEPASVASMVNKLSKRGAKLHFCYEAGPTGYGLCRQIVELGHNCVVVAPSLVPRRAGDRVKTNRRDAMSLARLHRAGELTAVWVPDEGHEAIRDLVRAREAAGDALKQARQQLQSFLLRHGRIYTGRKPWTRAHTRWLTCQAFDHPAHHILLAEYCQAIEDAGVRLDRLTKLVVETAASWSMAPVVAAYQAMRGVAFMTAVTFVVEIGDVRRFDNPRQLMAYLGLVPSESSTGERVKRGRITKAGNTRARRVLIEGAWTYRFPARVSSRIQARLEDLPRTVREIAWKGQVRLCARYRKLMAAGKPKVVAVTAIAREMAAFLWAIGQEVAPTAKI
ncbi:IS110 family transposase (plasmid) [Rhizobium sullae]|uniref:IS110 family transposase n=1 Tax=Rhizobium sullae TaxID=50338 RepID=A0ABY5XXM9_RHISU|nr:IS110 family transposase [Rhizobium sullae]UWU19243.1 IS110 family transposase [Rhizobium sullae]